jgi:protein phosphatase
MFDFTPVPRHSITFRGSQTLSKKKSENAAKPTMFFCPAGITNTGLVREHNEDAFCLPNQLDAQTLAVKGHLYVLADGMGGHQKGEVASAVTINTVSKAYYEIVKPLLKHKNPEEAITEALAQAIQKANNDVLDETEGGGTTVVAAVLFANHLITMNVGDSRAYLLRNNELYLLSRDHSLVSRLVEMGKISEEEAINHPRRNVLYQALGQGADVDIHVFSETLQLHDTILLCSDGLWGEVSEPDIKEALSAAGSLLVAAETLVELANNAGGADNITAIIVQVVDQPPPASNPDDTNPSLKKVIPPKPTTLPEGKFHTQNTTL